MILDANGMPILQPAVDNAETATFNTAFAAIGSAIAGAVPTASTTVPGISEHATDAETVAGVEPVLVVTTTGLRYALANQTRSIVAVNAGGTIMTTAFLTIPTNPCALTISVPTGGRLARITYAFRAICTAGTMDVGTAVSGATTVAATQAWTGAAHATANGAYATVFNSQLNGFFIEKYVSLASGSNTITAVARIGGAGGTKQVTNQLLTVELL